LPNGVPKGANGDDLISRLIRAEFEARRLDDMEIATFVRSLVAAGGETTTRTFSSVMTLLLQSAPRCWPACVMTAASSRS
jgi:cytochrome P450